jgi:hypothetical protein
VFKRSSIPPRMAGRWPRAQRWPEPLRHALEHVMLTGEYLCVYNFSFARLVFVSGLDQKLPAAMAKVNKHKVPSNAVWAQTIIASLFALVAFIVFPSLGIGGGRPIDIQTKVYDVLQAAVTVIWCISMVVLFVDVVIIIGRFLPRYEQTRLARPAVFYRCAVIGGLSALAAVVATLSGSWTPLISNDSGSVSIAGAQIAYGAWLCRRRGVYGDVIYNGYGSSEVGIGAPATPADLREAPETVGRPVVGCAVRISRRERRTRWTGGHRASFRRRQLDFRRLPKRQHQRRRRRHVGHGGHGLPRPSGTTVHRRP